MTEKHRVVVLLSGGLDSAVNLHMAKEKASPMLCLTFDYGQRAARREIEAARRLSKHYGVKHRVIKLDWLKRLTSAPIVRRGARLPHPEEDELDDIEGAARETARLVWVPNRNAVFINIAAAFAEAMDCDGVVVGFNAEEGATFPDNSREFLKAANDALRYSTLKGVKVICYTSRMKKTGIIRLAKRQGVPLNLVWYCYEGGRVPCRRCESCVRFERALRQSNCWNWYRELCKR